MRFSYVVAVVAKEKENALKEMRIFICVLNTLFKEMSRLI